MKRIISAALAVAMMSSPVVAQDSSVSGLTVSSGERPPPRIGGGAPMYSPEQTASFVCSNQGKGASLKLAEDAHRATVAAREVRRNPEATSLQMMKAERERQEAVRDMLGVGQSASQDQLVKMGVERFGGIEDTLSKKAGLRVEGVLTRRVLENGRAVLLIGGRVHNTGKARAEVIPVSARVVDSGGFSLASQSSLLDKVTLEPGESSEFVIRFRNPPQYTAGVILGFSNQFQTRNPRSCDFFDPLTFNPRNPDVARARETATPVAMPRVGSGAPGLTAQELAQAFPRLLGQAQRAFNAARTGACPPADHYAWRTAFKQSELAYEAWVATAAADEIRRDASVGPVGPGELEAAELQRQRMVNAYVASRPDLEAAQPCARRS